MKNLSWIILCVATLVLMVPQWAAAQSLTPKQRADIRTLRNLVIDCETHAGRLEHYLSQIQASGTQTGEKTIQDFNASAKQLEESFLKAQKLFTTLPTEDETVADLTSRANATASRYQKALAQANAAMKAADKAVAQAGGQDAINQDIAKLAAIAAQFAPFPNMMDELPADALALLRDYQPTVAEVQAFEAKYAAFLQGGTTDSAAIQRKLEDARNTLRRVQASAQEKVADIRQAAKAAMDTTEQLIATGVEQRRTLYFGPNGGVTQHLKMAEERLQLAQAIDSAAAAELAQQFERVNEKARQAGKTLETDIINSNTGPGDSYRGADRDALLQGARAAWAEAHPNDEIVKVTLPTADWKREAKWTWRRDAFYFTDRSDLQAAVVFKAVNAAGENELHYYPVDISKNHQNNDALRFTPWEKQPLETMPVQFRFLPGKL